jgi:hypothetical protein
MPATHFIPHENALILAVLVNAPPTQTSSHVKLIDKQCQTEDVHFEFEQILRFHKCSHIQILEGSFVIRTMVVPFHAKSIWYGIIII